MRDRITLLLNGARIEIRDIAPTMTLLQWLRQMQRLPGTKEGCAEGDCGACTVVVGHLRDGAVRYRAINACLAFIATLEGASVMTVEGLKAPDGGLHPVQQAMVDCHGSQCGFCTPGFVMSLYALYLNQTGVPSRATINTWLAGNLCRCTGYSSIATAAQQMFEPPRPTWDAERRAADARSLQALHHSETILISHQKQRMFLPATMAELCDLAVKYPGANIVSGATDIGLWVTKHGRELPTVISTNRVQDDGFAQVKHVATSNVYVIGGGTTHTDAAAALPIPAFTELWRRFAGQQIRNSGTVGGNIANGSPIGDMAPALIALDAQLYLRRGTETRAMPLENYFKSYGVQDRQPGDIVASVAFSPPHAPDAFSIYKVTKRFDDDISAICGAFYILVEDGKVRSARIAFGGLAEIPKRAEAVENFLQDKPWTSLTIDAALPAFEKDFQPISDLRASADYRLQVAKSMLLRHFIERTEPDTATRLVGRAASFGV